MNVKALYKRAQTHVGLGDLDFPEFDIKKALEFDSEGGDVKL